MIADALHALGGVGMFLLGMIWLTEGLRGLGGGAMREALARFTRTPLSGAVTGALTTAVIQSSSATTVTAVGFVSAGLLTFPQALGVIFGANIGTTITGWMVAILGFKLDLGTIMMPVLFLSALLRLLGRPRFALVGTALAGFSLVFIGIDAMKAGMAGFEGVVTPESFPADDLLGRLQLVGIGVAITVVTQSSSAGVATALAALGAGAINLPQAAAMVIGMDVGTTFTAAVATLGGSTATRRTGLSHVIYNVLTGIMAFLLLAPFTAAVAPLVATGQGQIALVAFHSGFNLLGVLLVLPFTAAFARLVIALVPERGGALSRGLDTRLLRDPDAATDALTATLAAIARAQAHLLAARLVHETATRDDLAGQRAVGEALAQARTYLEAIPPGGPGTARAGRLATCLHILDHLRRLHFRCGQEARLRALDDDLRLLRLRRLLRALADQAAGAQDTAAVAARLDRLRRLLRDQRETYRRRVLADVAAGAADAAAAMQRLDAMRWLHRVAYHLWRIEVHLSRLDSGAPPVTPRREAAVEVLED